MLHKAAITPMKGDRMCSRFTLSKKAAELESLFAVKMPHELLPRYNIAPSQPVIAVRMRPNAPQREAVLLQWGLVPSWAKDPTMGSRLINARSETVAEKPAFRMAFRHRRCLIPSDGFYEWRGMPGKKQPYHIRMRDGALFAFAGLWEVWEGLEGYLETCAILTTEANHVVRPLHNRMPVILPPADYALWLDTSMSDTKKLHALLHPYPSEEMVAIPVSTRVNNPTNEGPALLEPIALG